MSKVATQVAKMGAKVAKLVAKEAGVDEDIVDGAADIVEHQADAGRDASITDRVKMAGMTAMTVTFFISLSLPLPPFLISWRHSRCSR